MSTHNAAIQPKYSHEAGVTPQPEELIGAEIAINTADAKIFTKNAAGEIVTIVGGGGGGGAVDSVNGQTGVVELGAFNLADVDYNYSTYWTWVATTVSASAAGLRDGKALADSGAQVSVSPISSDGGDVTAALRAWSQANPAPYDTTVSIDGVETVVTVTSWQDYLGVTNGAAYTPRLRLGTAASGSPIVQSGSLVSLPGFNAWAAANGYERVDTPALPLSQGDVLKWNDNEQKFKPGRPSPSVQDIDDIFIPTGDIDKTVLQFDTSTSKWTAQDLDFTLEAASDYSLRTDSISGNTYPKEEGDALLWDGTAWSPGNPISGQAVSALSDVNTVTNPPSDGNALVWNELNGVWQPGVGGGGGGSESLEELNDVAFDSVVAGDVLRYDGTNWADGRVNYEELSNRPAIPAALGDLTDTDLSTAPAIGQILVWNGLAWAPDNQTTGGGGISTVGGALTERADTTVSTGSMNSGASQNIQFTGLGEAGQFVEVSVSSPSWVRFYPTAQDRDSDATRDVETDPLPGSGVLLEVVTTSANQTVRITPGAVYYNNDTLPDQTLYARVTNQSSASADLLVTVRAYTQISTDSIDGGSFGSG